MDRVERLEPRLAGDLCEATRALTEAGIPYAVIGANALILHGIVLPRTTRDLDLVVVAEGGLDRLRGVLEAVGFRSTSIAHRFVTGAGTDVDILPLSPKSETRIEFPDGERIRSVGLPESVRYAEDIESGKCTLRVARLPILAAIKVHVATVRMGDRDLTDALAIMVQFEARGTRRFELDYEVVSGLVWETAGAFLLGCDATAVLEEESRDRVERAVQTLLEDPRMADDQPWGEERAPLLRAFRAGLGTQFSSDDG